MSRIGYYFREGMLIPERHENQAQLQLLYDLHCVLVFSRGIILRLRHSDVYLRACALTLQSLRKKRYGKILFQLNYNKLIIFYCRNIALFNFGIYAIPVFHKQIPNRLKQIMLCHIAFVSPDLISCVIPSTEIQTGIALGL